MRKRMITCFLSVLLLAALTLHAQAVEVPYESYTYDAENHEQPAPALYLPDFSAGFGTTEQPAGLTDLFVYDGLLYALDAAQSRLLVLDMRLHLLDELHFTDETGAPLLFSQAQGLFVCEAGIYISDTQRLCVERFDWSGVRQHSYTRPDSPAYDSTVPFAVTRVIVDRGLNVYALVDGMYSGAVMLSESGDFLGFFGPNEVEMTVEMLVDQSWKKLLTEEQKNAMDRFVPIAYTSFDIDGENFVYTCSRNAVSESTRVRKLNPSGKGLWDGKNLLFGDYIPQSQWVSGLANVSQLVDVDIADSGILSVLDAARGRVFQYDPNGKLLGVFGGSGKQLGTFEKATALETYENYLFVLDGKAGDITRFSLTDYGRLMRRAVGLYNSGEYAAAKPIWEEILSRNSYCQPACTGIGKALMQEGASGEALSYLKRGQDREAYSEAFEEYRFTFMRSHFALLLLGAAVLAALIWTAIFIWKKYRKEKTYHLFMLKAPIATLEELLYQKRLSVGFSSGVVVFWFLLEIVKYFATGFPFNRNEAGDFNIFLPLMTTCVIYLLFVIVNWSVSCLTDGRGTFKQIYCASAYVLLPYLLTQLLVLLLSQMFTLDEKPFLTMISLAGYVWSGALLLIVITRVHDFSIGKACVNLLLTAVGIGIVFFLLFLLVVLFEQVANLIITIFNELTLRA